MIRITLQAAFCVCFPSFLVAQQLTENGLGQTATANAPNVQTHARPLDIPRKTIVPLVPLESVSSATAYKGQLVRLAVKENVILNGSIIIPKGSPASGVISDLRKAVLGKRDGSLSIKPVSLTLPDGSLVTLRQHIDTGGDEVCEGFVGCLPVAAIIAVSFPFAVAFSIASFFPRHHASESGNDIMIGPCQTLWGSTKTISRIKIAAPNQIQISPPVIEIGAICSTPATLTP